MAHSLLSFGGRYFVEHSVFRIAYAMVFLQFRVRSELPWNFIAFALCESTNSYQYSRSTEHHVNFVRHDLLGTSDCIRWMVSFWSQNCAVGIVRICPQWCLLVIIRTFSIRDDRAIMDAVHWVYNVTFGLVCSVRGVTVVRRTCQCCALLTCGRILIFGNSSPIVCSEPFDFRFP